MLFSGGADAMRRQALLPIGEHLPAGRIAAQRLLDVACGTGRFLGFVKHNYPRLPVVGLDLAPPICAAPPGAADLVAGSSWRAPRRRCRSPTPASTS